MDLKKLRQILKALGEDTRLRVINLLYKRELMVKEICQTLKISQPTISKHLAKLRLLKIVSDKRQGNIVYYRVNINSEEGEIVKFLLSRFNRVMAFQDDMEQMRTKPKK